MKSFNINQAITFIDTKTPFSSVSLRSISFMGYSTTRLKIAFNDETVYIIDMDEETYYLSE